MKGTAQGTNKLHPLPKLPLKSRKDKLHLLEQRLNDISDANQSTSILQKSYGFSLSRRNRTNPIHYMKQGTRRKDWYSHEHKKHKSC